MPSYGRNPYPRRYGGGKHTLVIEHEALLDAFAPGWDRDGAENYAECYAHAVALTMIWAVNKRLVNQAIPSKMLEALPDWEEILHVPPLLTDSSVTRRARVAAKLRGFAANTLSDLEAAALLAAGTNYVALSAPDPANVWSYWPGVNPGPPGFEWCTNNASVSVVVTQTGLSDADFVAMLERVAQAIEPPMPAWMNFNIGVDSGAGFVCSLGVLGLTLLAPGP